MKDFKKGGFGGKPSFGGRPDYKKKTWDKPNRDFGGDRQMFDATCSGCGNACQVPFRPSGDKEVFCNNCFTKAKGISDRHGSFDDRAPRQQTGGQNIDAVVRQLQVVASKLDQLVMIMNAQSKNNNKASEKPLAAVIKEAVVPAAVPVVEAKKKVAAKKTTAKAAPKKVAAKKVTKKK